MAAQVEREVETFVNIMNKSTSSTAFGVVVDKVTFVNKLPLLNSATSDDERPIIGQTYHHLCDITFSSGSNCQQVLDFLLARLKDDSCCVKLKALKVMRFLVENGHPQFRQTLRRSSQAVTEATKFSQPISGLQNNAFSAMVRTEAKELCEITFTVADNDGKISRPPVDQRTIAGGMGSSMDSSVTSGKMRGFGNTLQPKRSMIDRFTNGLQDIADTIMNPSSWKQASYASDFPQDNQFGAYVPIRLDPIESVDRDHGSRISQQPIKRAASPHHQPKGHTPGVAGGGWEEEMVETCDTSRMCDATSMGDVDDTTKEVSRLEMEVLENREAEMVADTVKSAASDLLTRAELRTFTDKCITLSCDAVVDRIGEMLSTQNSSNVLRSLCLLECLLRTDLVNMDHISTTCSSHLSHLSTSQHPAPTLNKATKLKLILEKLVKPS